MKPTIAGLYAITPDWGDTTRLILAVRQAIAGGARVVQYRNKTADAARRLEQALALSAVCGRDGATFIINDHVELAQTVDADGVHMGATDGDLAAARQKLGRGKYIGASCYDSIDLAHTALAVGADHVAFGSAFSSSTKPSAVRAPHSLYAAAGALGVPVVAIGGITCGNAAQVIAAGAHAVAVISDLFDAPDIRARAAQFSTLFRS